LDLISKKVLYLGSNGFPFGSAMIQRQIQISKLFLDIGFKVNVLNRRGAHSKSITQREKIKKSGKYQGIEYIYCSLIPYKSTNFFIRNSAKFLGYISEFLFIFYYVLFKDTKYFFSNCISLSQLKYYSFLSKLLKTELIYDYVEYMDSVSDRDQMEIEDASYSFDRNFYKYTDKIVVISNFLKNHLDNLQYKNPILKIPPIIDFSFFEGVDPKKNIEFPYLLFCGSAAYFDIIIFVIRAFTSSKADHVGYKLKLVLNGSLDQLLRVKKYIDPLGNKENIVILSKLTYNDLIGYYKSSVALLIPISNNLQDRARFPFKLCEYTAAKRPIITSDMGAITEYFENNVNALISKSGDIESFASKINLILEKHDLANKIGAKGYELGKDVFNYRAYTEDFKLFIDKKNVWNNR